MAQAALPEVFEGSEKRLELHFKPQAPWASREGLRAVPRPTLDELMSLAACEIVSKTSNEALDSYVLSESSLFVYPHTWVLKTCGTTKLLDCLERLIAVAGEHGLAPSDVKYSRASFLFPSLQPDMYRSFDAEVEHLRRHLGHLGNGGSAFVLGDKLHGLQWHLFVASDEVLTAAASSVMPALDNASASQSAATDSGSFTACMAPGSNVPAQEARYTFEVAMTDLDPDAAAHYVRDDKFVSSSETTTCTGIRALLPEAEIDDYVFEPCGYSMNGIQGGGYMTIHVTPEEAFSYASCELHGFPSTSFQPAQLVRAVERIFQPGRLTVTASVDFRSNVAGLDDAWGASLVLDGYGCSGATCQELPTGGRVCSFSLVKLGFARCPRTASMPAIARRWPSFALNGPRDAIGSLNAALLRAASSGAFAARKPGFKLEHGETCSGSSTSDLDVEELPTRSCTPEAPQDLIAVLAAIGAVPLDDTSDAAVVQFLNTVIARRALCDSFLLVDLGNVCSALKRWKSALPRVRPLLSAGAVLDPVLASVLFMEGASFDVANEGDVVMLSNDAAVGPQHMTMLAPLRRPRDIRSAHARGVRCFAFDTAAELSKLKLCAPNSALLLRVGCEQDRCAPEEALELAHAARQSGLPVVGMVATCAGSERAELHDVLASVRRAWGALADAGHRVRWLHIEAQLSSPDVLTPALEAAFPRSDCPTLDVTLRGDAVCSDAVSLGTQVHGQRGADLFVSDLPPVVPPAAAVLSLGDAALSDCSAQRHVCLCDEKHSHQVQLAAEVGIGDWLLMRHVQVPSRLSVEKVYIANKDVVSNVA